MNKNFNDLFDDFFNKKKQPTKPSAKIILTKLQELQDINKIDEDLEHEIELSLGTPDATELFNNDGVSFERKIWHTEDGDIVKIVLLDEEIEERIHKSMDDQLKEAVENEDYEKAAIIRDLIVEKNLRNNLVF